MASPASPRLLRISSCSIVAFFTAPTCTTAICRHRSRRPRTVPCQPLQRTKKAFGPQPRSANRYGKFCGRYAIAFEPDAASFTQRWMLLAESFFPVGSAPNCATSQ